MQSFDRITGRRVEKKGLIIFFYLVLLSVFTPGAALAQQQPSRFESTGLDRPAQDTLRNEHGFAVYAQAHKTNLSGGAK